MSQRLTSKASVSAGSDQRQSLNRQQKLQIFAGACAIAISVGLIRSDFGIVAELMVKESSSWLSSASFAALDLAAASLRAFSSSFVSPFTSRPLWLARLFSCALFCLASSASAAALSAFDLGSPEVLATTSSVPGAPGGGAPASGPRGPGRPGRAARNARRPSPPIGRSDPRRETPRRGPVLDPTHRPRTTQTEARLVRVRSCCSSPALTEGPPARSGVSPPRDARFRWPRPDGCIVGLQRCPL